MIWIIILILSYLLGAIPNGLIFGKLFWNVDLRQHGSGNIGATNAWRVIGKSAGLLIFAMDFLKGFIAVYLAEIFLTTPLAMVVAGFFAIVGHTLSIFIQFQGGKAVATGLGVISMMMPKVAAIVFIVWLVIVLITRYVSLGSIVASILVPILAISFHYPLEFLSFGTFAATLIVLRHKDNIRRLINGTENKI